MVRCSVFLPKRYMKLISLRHAVSISRAGIDPIHAGVDHDLKQLSRCRLIFLYPPISLIRSLSSIPSTNALRRRTGSSAGIKISTSSGSLI